MHLFLSRTAGLRCSGSQWAFSPSTGRGRVSRSRSRPSRSSWDFCRWITTPTSSNQQNRSIRRTLREVSVFHLLDPMQVVTHLGMGERMYSRLTSAFSMTSLECPCRSHAESPCLNSALGNARADYGAFLVEQSVGGFCTFRIGVNRPSCSLSLEV